MMPDPINNNISIEIHQVDIKSKFYTVSAEGRLNHYFWFFKGDTYQLFDMDNNRLHHFDVIKSVLTQDWLTQIILKYDSNFPPVSDSIRLLRKIVKYARESILLEKADKLFSAWSYFDFIEHCHTVNIMMFIWGPATFSIYDSRVEEDILNLCR